MAKSKADAAIELTQRLISFDTINPPGRETACAEYLCAYLEHAGICAELLPFGEGRANVLASVGGSADKPPLCFTGHIDTVPLGIASWSRDPFAGEVSDGRLYGRGSSDMKSGVAAFVVALARLRDRLGSGPGVCLIITGGEETGCEGASHLAREGRLSEGGALIVGEPTANAPLAGHKGALWLRATTKGVTAHGSMPELGENAIYKAARAISQLETYEVAAGHHACMGGATLNVGTVHGGLNLNSVPDHVEIGIDIRTVPGCVHAKIGDDLARYLGADASLEPIVDVGAVWTDPENGWFRRFAEIAADVTGEVSGLGAASYFTDASVLVGGMGGVPAAILGPGEPKMAHQTDEYCELRRIEEAVEIYSRAIADWCGL
ncbi:MAG: M20 family metallopeptidase [Rhodovibrionaceae bacterium]